MTHSDSPILLEVRDSVAHLTLNRPASGNAIDLEMAEAMLGAAQELQSHAQVRALLISGAGPRFCVGGSIHAFVGAREQLPALIRNITAPLHEALLQFVQLRVPIVAAIQGAAAGAGLGIALIADWIVAAQSAKFRAGYTALGFTGDAGITYSLPRRVGASVARKVLLRNAPLTAAQALQLGLIDDCVADSELLDSATLAATELAAGSLEAFVRVRNLLHVSAGHSFEQQLRLEADTMIAAASCGDVREGIAAFVEKRAPRFES
jgi:2-(1,2-epoxy-1,2-dihydrophenyl)acetyl-CoA isomerase